MMIWFFFVVNKPIFIWFVECVCNQWRETTKKKSDQTRESRIWIFKLQKKTCYFVVVSFTHCCCLLLNCFFIQYSGWFSALTVRFIPKQNNKNCWFWWWWWFVESDVNFKFGNFEKKIEFCVCCWIDHVNQPLEKKKSLIDEKSWFFYRLKNQSINRSIDFYRHFWYEDHYNCQQQQRRLEKISFRTQNIRISFLVTATNIRNYFDINESFCVYILFVWEWVN